MALPKFATLDLVTSYVWVSQPALGSDDPTEEARYIIDTVDLQRDGVPINKYRLAKRRTWRFLFVYKTLAELQNFETFAEEQIFYFYPDSALTPKFKVVWQSGDFPLVKQPGGTYNLDMVLEEY